MADITCMDVIKLRETRVHLPTWGRGGVWIMVNPCAFS